MNESERALRDAYAILDRAGWFDPDPLDELLSGLDRLKDLRPRMTQAQGVIFLHVLLEVRRHLHAALAYRQEVRDLEAEVGGGG